LPPRHQFVQNYQYDFSDINTLRAVDPAPPPQITGEMTLFMYDAQ
jgi:hypothetical protein